MKAPSTRPAAVLGLDVGKSSHWACLIDSNGEVLASAPVRNREAELDALFASAPAGTRVGVDQFRNIGSLAVRRARAAGRGGAYLPGLAASRAAGCASDSRQRLPASTTNHIAEHAADDASAHCPKDGGPIFLKRNRLHGNHRAVLYRLSAAHLTAGIGIAAVVGAARRKHGERKHAYGCMFDFQHKKPPIESQDENPALFKLLA